MNKEMIDGLIRTHGVTVPKQQHVKIYFSDMDKLTHDLHKAFIQAQVNDWNELNNSLCDILNGKNTQINRNNIEIALPLHIQNKIQSLTKLLEDE